MANNYYTAKAIAKILDEYANDETREVFDNQADNIDDEASYIAERLKFYEMEMDAQDYCRGYHTLKEWASYGLNKVVFNGEEYWDGHKDSCEPITDEENEKLGQLEVDYWDTDEDGYKYVVLKQVKGKWL